MFEVRGIGGWWCEFHTVLPRTAPPANWSMRDECGKCSITNTMNESTRMEWYCIAALRFSSTIPWSIPWKSLLSRAYQCRQMPDVNKINLAVKTTYMWFDACRCQSLPVSAGHSHSIVNETFIPFNINVLTASVYGNTMKNTMFRNCC